MTNYLTNPTFIVDLYTIEMPTIKRLISPHETKEEDKPQRWSNTDNKQYKTAGWIKFRLGYINSRIEKGQITCDGCNRLFLETKDIQLDHIRPISQGGDMFSYSNIQMLCRSCHTRKTSKEIKERRH